MDKAKGHLKISSVLLCYMLRRILRGMPDEEDRQEDIRIYRNGKYGAGHAEGLSECV